MTSANNISIMYYFALMLLLAMPVMGADAKQWNNADAQQLADQLVSDAFKLRVEWRGHPSADVGGGHASATYNVRHFQNLALQLCDALEDGKGQIDTRPIYDALVDAASGLEEYVQAGDHGKWPPIKKALSEASATLGQLEALYSS